MKNVLMTPEPGDHEEVFLNSTGRMRINPWDNRRVSCFYTQMLSIENYHLIDRGEWMRNICKSTNA